MSREYQTKQGEGSAGDWDCGHAVSGTAGELTARNPRCNYREQPGRVKKLQISRTALCVLFLLSWAGTARAADIGVAPMTQQGSSSEYGKRGKFSIGDDGVLLYDYGAKYDGLGKWRNPFFISHYAHILYGEWLRDGHSEEAKRRLLIQADYLLKSATARGDALVWTYPFKNTKYHLAPGWISGIGQSRIAGILARAHAMTGREEFRDAARRAMNVYLKPLTEGGVTTKVGDTIWIEEAPDPSGRSFKILNGHITGLSGVLDYYQITGDAIWKDVFDRGVDAVRRDIAHFDLGHTSLYALGYVEEPMKARRDTYHRLHIRQLLWLESVTGDAYFAEWASRFLFNLVDPVNPTDAARYAPIVNYCNHQSSFPQLAALNGAKALQISCDGWLIFQRGTATELVLDTGQPGDVTVSVSDRFADWRKLSPVVSPEKGATIALPNANFIRIDFSKDAKEISVSATKGHLVSLERSWLGDLRKSFSVLRN